MRSAEEIRAGKLSTLQSVLVRPGMWGGGFMYEAAVRGVLQDLAFIDEREPQLEREIDDLRAQRLCSNTGVQGVLAQLDEDEWVVTHRTASVYARVAAQLGYFQPSRRLTAQEWVRAKRDASAWARRAPRTSTDVTARLGPPSYECAGQWPPVLGYAGPGNDAWLYFDFPNGGAERPLEFVRLPRRPFARCVIDLRETDRA